MSENNTVKQLFTDGVFLEIEKGYRFLQEKRLFRVELKTWPAREIPFLVFSFNKEDAEKEGWSFIRLHGWKGKIGKIEDLGLSLSRKLEKDHRATFPELLKKSDIASLF